MVVKASFLVLSRISLGSEACSGRISVALSVPQLCKPFTFPLDHKALMLLIPQSGGVNLTPCSRLPPASALSSEATEHSEIQLSKVSDDIEYTEEEWYLASSAMSSSGKILVEVGRGVCIWRVG